MSNLIEKIVSYLNEPPFRMKLRLIEFDSKSSYEHFNILVLVINALGNDAHDSKIISSSLFGNASQLRTEIIPFLSIVQYDYELGDEAFFHNLSNGEKSVLYPLLAYCLANQKEIQRELYLAMFLTPIDLPLQISMTSKHLAPLAQNYRNLQREFREIHTNLTDLKDTEKSLNDTKEKFKALSKEKNYLANRVQNNMNAITHDDGLNILFQKMIDIRKQEIEASRIGKFLEKEQAINVALQEELDRWNVAAAEFPMKSTNMDSIIENIKHQIAVTSKKVQSDHLMSKKKLEEDLIAKIRLLERPTITTSSLEESVRHRNQTASILNSRIRELRHLHDTKSTTKIQMLKRHFNIVQSKADSKELEVTKKNDEVVFLRDNLKILEEENDYYNGSHFKSSIQLPDGRTFSTLSEKKSYIDKEHALIKDKEIVRQKIGCLEQEVVELDGTISNLMKSINDKELDHRAQEETAGAIGYHKAKCDLKDSKEEAERMNNLKEKEMHTISEIVTQMRRILKQKQSKLQPMIENLKELRNEHRKMQFNHGVHKEQYHKLLKTSAQEKRSIEEQVSAVKNKFMKLYRLHKHYEHEYELVNLTLQRFGVDYEDDNQTKSKKHGRTAFSSIKESYEFEFERQSKLRSHFLLQKDELQQNEVYRVNQKFSFEQLLELLQLKWEVGKTI